MSEGEAYKIVIYCPESLVVLYYYIHILYEALSSVYIPCLFVRYYKFGKVTRAFTKTRYQQYALYLLNDFCIYVPDLSCHFIIFHVDDWERKLGGVVNPFLYSSCPPKTLSILTTFVILPKLHVSILLCTSNLKFESAVPEL